MKDRYDLLINQVINQEEIQPAIIAGHYCLSDKLGELSNNCETEFNSFLIGVSTFKNFLLAEKNPSFILFVNDIGIDPTDRANIKSNYTIPDNFKRVLEQENIDKNHVKIIFESSIRNKASRNADRKYKSHFSKFSIENSDSVELIRCVENECVTFDKKDKRAFTIATPGGGKLVVKEGNSPKCNMILATLFDTAITSPTPKRLIINIFNSIYINRISLECYVHQTLFDQSVAFINVFCEEKQIVDCSHTLEVC